MLLFPFAGLAFLEWEGVELGLLVLSFFFAVASLAVSYFRKHRNVMPLTLAGIGFMLFILGKLFSSEIAEIICSILGGCLVIIAHYINIKLIKKNTIEKNNRQIKQMQDSYS